jgi:hypothetical protein
MRSEGEISDYKVVLTPWNDEQNQIASEFNDAHSDGREPSLEDYREYRARMKAARSGQNSRTPMASARQDENRV